MTISAPLEPSPDNPPNSTSSGIELHARSSRLQASKTEHGPSDQHPERDLMSNTGLSDKTRLEQVIVHGNDVVERSAANGHDIVEAGKPESRVYGSLHSPRSVAYVDASLATFVPPNPKPDNDTKRSSFRAGSVAGAAATAATSNTEETYDLENVSTTTPVQLHSTSKPSRMAPTNGTTGPKRPSKNLSFGLHQNTGNYGTCLSANAPAKAITLMSYVGDDYEAKYEPDPWGEEVGSNARVWRVYLDEAEAYDSEMTEQWKDTVDVLLVFVSSL